MIVDLRVHLADLIVLAMLAAAGVCLVVWAVACFLRWAGERVTDWLHTRIDPPWWWKPWLYRRTGQDDLEELPPPLPPERTWEQMTSHQLPVMASGEREVHWRSGRCWCDEFHRDQATTLALVERPPGVLAHLDDPRHERALPWWEAEIRSAYAALGLEGTGFTRAMAARVRELTP